ncbi:acetyl-CoA carboxylase biotin carboxyl carrier protein [Candidatus Marinamargulisbacteria bacterium SCGC AG-343-D04]|nr:acetyl-CoA carboxylase biotin carboxyl carrier protein [Candidatus Marinamargulisbacteria bacterium SCGC AG-343-D04]
MDFKDLKRLVDLVEKANVSHVSIDENGTKIEIKKEFSSSSQSVVIPQQQFSQFQQAAPVAPQGNTQAPDSSENPEKAKKDDNVIEFKSQMVGTFYTSSSPESPPFVKVGDSVESGKTLCVIEAMKLFNEIECDCSGVIEEICVKNEQAVEFGQTLFLIRKA